MQPGKLMAVALVAVACGRAELVPAAPGVNAGVRVSADADAWSGAPAVERKLVPVEIAIENHRRETVHFSRADVVLAGPGQELRALAPERIVVEPERQSLGLDPRTPDHLELYAGQYYRHPYDGHPTAELRAAAIADGPIAPGQVRRGFVYFERLPRDLEHAELRVALRVERHQAPLIVAVPFVVRR